MARPIEETPMIVGEEAERFFEEIKNPKPEDPARIERGKQIYEYFKAQGAFDNLR